MYYVIKDAAGAVNRIIGTEGFWDTDHKRFHITMKRAAPDRLAETWSFNEPIWVKIMNDAPQATTSDLEVGKPNDAQ